MVSPNYDQLELVSDQDSDVLTGHYQFPSCFIEGKEFCDWLWSNFPERGLKVELSQSLKH